MGWRQWRTVTFMVFIFAAAVCSLLWSVWTFYNVQSFSWLCLWSFDCVEVALFVAHALVSYFFCLCRMVRPDRGPSVAAPGLPMV